MARRLPKLCLHKARHLGYVTNPRTKREHYFTAAWGPGDKDHPSLAIQVEYDLWLAKFLLRRQEPAAELDSDGLTVAALLNAYHAWSLTYYRRADGKVTSEPANIAHACEAVLRMYPAVEVDDFGPLALKEVRAVMVMAGSSRKFINDSVHRIRRAFRWGVENELVKAETLARLKAVAPLTIGRTTAPEQRKVKPVPLATVEATLPYLSPLFRALVRFHLYGGMRAEEAVCVRPADIDRSAVPWLYSPEQHKTRHHGIVKEIWLGPKARAAIEPLLVNLSPQSFVFASRGRGHRRSYVGHLTTSGYRNKVATACRRAKIPAWLPRQLRHTALSYIRQHHERGIEAAQVIAGHSDASTTEIYAERSAELARDAAERFG